LNHENELLSLVDSIKLELRHEFKKLQESLMEDSLPVFMRSKSILHYFKIGNTTLHNYHSNGLINKYKLGGSNYYKTQEILDLIESSKEE